MAIQTIANQLRSLRDRYWGLVADALRDIEQIVSNIYRDMGWFQVAEKSSGIRKDVLQTPRLMIVGGQNSIPIGEIRNIDGRLVVFLDPNSSAGALYFESKNKDSSDYMRARENGITIYNGDDEFMLAVTAYRDNLGNDISTIYGQTDNGATSQFALVALPLFASVENTFKDAVDGDTVTTLKSEEATGTLSVKKGADNEVSAVADAAAVVLTVKNASSDSTIKPESVVTPRLGVGGSAPGTDGHATVSTFLGVGASAPAASEALRVVGKSHLAGELEVDNASQFDGAAEFNSTVTVTGLAAGGTIVGQVGGTLSTLDAATARFYLDVYTKAEVDTEIANAISAAIAGLSIDSVVDHNHGGTVPDGGGHTHTITYTP